MNQIFDLLDKLWAPAIEVAKKERQMMQEIIEAEGDTFQLASWDWWYYAEKLRQQKYALNDKELKPYFELTNVRQGAFYVAQRLFGVTFEPLDDVPVWNEVVKPYAVYGADREFLGVYMTDDYARESKRGGAWMSTYRDASNIDGRDVRPIVTNNLNLAVPAEGEPTLLTYNQVETVFHEFGHALHGLLTKARYPRFSGTAGSPRDFVEFPSQFMEHYATEPEVLAIYARHAETGEVIPQELVGKVRAARTHNQGFKTTEYIAASLLDLNWHNLTHEEALAITDARAFEQEVLAKYEKPIADAVRADLEAGRVVVVAPGMDRGSRPRTVSRGAGAVRAGAARPPRDREDARGAAPDRRRRDGLSRYRVPVAVGVRRWSAPLVRRGRPHAGRRRGLPERPDLRGKIPISGSRAPTNGGTLTNGRSRPTGDILFRVARS